MLSLRSLVKGWGFFFKQNTFPQMRQQAELSQLTGNFDNLSSICQVILYVKQKCQTFLVPASERIAVFLFYIALNSIYFGFKLSFK